MGAWTANALGCLAPLAAVASVLAIIEILGPPARWPGWSPALRIAAALLVSMLNVLLAPAGQGRRRMFGFFFFVTTAASVVRYGDRLGLHLTWQRWVLAVVLSLPFWLLFAASTPGALKSRLDARKERRSRR